MSIASLLLKCLGIDPEQLTPLGITRLLIQQQQSGISPIEVARQLARVPGIRQLLPDDANPEAYWRTLMEDPDARASIHPLNRAALKQYIVDSLTHLKEATRS